jgi:AraC-like DNA-binding protein
MPADIPVSALSVTFLQAGQSDGFADGLTHHKVVPQTIMAQVVAGSYEISCDGKAGVARRGEFFLTPPNRPMTITHHWDRKRHAMHARWIHAVFRLFDAMEYTSLLDMPLIVGGEAGREMGEVVQGVLDVQEGGRGSLRVAARRSELALRAARIITDVSKVRPEAGALLGPDDRLLGALRFVDASYGERIDVDRLARVARLSRTRFHHLFQSRIGCTPMAYLKRVRIARAQHLLIGSDASMAEVAATVGFADQFHFSREFKKQAGVSPSTYRATHRDLLV